MFSFLDSNSVQHFNLVVNNIPDFKCIVDNLTIIFVEANFIKGYLFFSSQYKRRAIYKNPTMKVVKIIRSQIAIEKV